MATKVVNLYKEPYDVYIGRGSTWGNPFVIGKDGDRESVIHLYKKYLWQQILEGRITKRDFQNIQGQTLGCFCKPQACHGDVIIKAMNWMLETRDD